MPLFRQAWHRNLNVPSKPINAGMRKSYLKRVNFGAQAIAQGERSQARSTLNFDGASVRFRNPSGNREAQPNATAFAGPRLVRTVEAIKDVWQIDPRNADSGISKLCHGGAIFSPEPNGN